MGHLKAACSPSSELADVIPGEEVVMIRCLDIHTHHPAPQPLAVISVGVDDFNPLEGQMYSLGIHPWLTTQSVTPETWAKFEELAALPSVVAIGECGIDKLKGGLLYKQLIVLQRQIEISEKLAKPLILHDVKAHDVIVGLKRDLNPKQKWLVHGFRYKPTVARMMTDAGIFLSFGESFNADSLKGTPKNLILAETDESTLTIQEIIANLGNSLGMGDQDIMNLIAENTNNFLFGE